MKDILHAIFSRRMISVFFLGFSSGLPLLLIGSTLRAWMKEANVDLTVIGLFALVGLPYSLKFLWSPLLDRYVPPFLDRRRGWIAVFQIALSVAFAVLAFSNPGENPWFIALIAFIIAFLSSSQDIAIDAYRREILPDNELGLGASFAVNGYRIGMLLAGAGALPIADYFGWQTAYLVMAFSMAASILITLLSPSVSGQSIAPPSILQAVIGPFKEYFSRRGAIEILLFILLFKIGDQMASDMLTPFYLDVGFTKTEIGVVSKFFGFWATIIGGLVGGILMLRFGIMSCLWFFGILQAASTACFSILAGIGNSIPALASVIAFENLSSGMGTAAYIGFMASLCNRKFTATQYALLSSLMGIPRVFFGSSSGYLAKHLGWQFYFIFCTVIAVPGLLMLLRAKVWKRLTSE